MKLDTAKVRRLCLEKFGSKPGERPSHGQSELAACAEISPVTLSRILNGHSRPLDITIAALAGALGVDAVALLVADPYRKPGDDW